MLKREGALEASHLILHPENLNEYCECLDVQRLIELNIADAEKRLQERGEKS